MEAKPHLVSILVVASMLLVPLGALVAPSKGQVSTGASAPVQASGQGEGVAMDMELNALVSPGYGHEGNDMPAYLGYSINTQFHVPDGTQRLERNHVSNTVTVPREAWSPGDGTQEWMRGLGVIAGGISPAPKDTFADNYYLWTGMQEGALAADGDNVGHIKAWSGSYDAYQVEHTPTGQQGTFQWEHRGDWSNVLEATWTTHPRTTLPDGSSASSPASTSFTRAMYLDHAQLRVDNGDIDASTGDVEAPGFEFRQPTPPGTVMNLQMVGWSPAGPWGSYVDLSPDFATGIRTGPTGEWRLPLEVTLEQGGFWPERVQPPEIASPQYAAAMRAIAIPLLPTDAGPGANDILLTADMAPGEVFVAHLALHQPDGSMETTKLVLDEPGPRSWRVSNGQLIELDGHGPEPRLASLGSLAPLAPAGDATGSTGLDGSPSSGEPSAASDGSDGAENTFSMEVNDAGRPVVRNLTRDGVRLVETLDTHRVITDAGSSTLGETNRDGSALVWEHPSSSQGRKAAAYLVDDLLVLERTIVTEDRLWTTVDSHSLTGEPIPHAVETTAHLADVLPVDRLSGELTHATRLLDAPLSPRVVLPTPTQQFSLDPRASDETTVEIGNAGELADGSLLTDPVFTVLSQGPDVWGSWIRPLVIAPHPLDAPEAGAFTSMQTYRVTPELVGAFQGLEKFMDGGIGGDVIEPTRDFDGHEPIAIALGAADPHGNRLLQEDIRELFVDLRTLEGDELFSGTLEDPPFSPDGGQSWGVVLYPSQDLDPMDLTVYARAIHDGGLVTRESSVDVPGAAWRFTVDRIPLDVTSLAPGSIEGTTEPLANVTVELPELALTAQTTADAQGAFSLALDLAGVPSGDYEAVVHAVAPAPGEPKDLAASALVPSPGQGLPEDDAATTTARIQHIAGGTDPSAHRSDDEMDSEAAAAFLAGREEAGAYDDSLRATAWAVQGLDAMGRTQSPSTSTYLASLQAGPGFAWRPGQPASAVATGLASSALAVLDQAPPVDPGPLVRWDGSAGLASTHPASSLEATGLLLAALEATGQLDALDPWWTAQITRWLETGQPRSPAEAFAQRRALQILGASSETEILGDTLDAVAYRALSGLDTQALGSYQLATDGGFTLTLDGASSQALATGLALATLGSPSS